VFSLFKKRTAHHKYPTDIHSHLLPGLDDGVKSLEESMEILHQFHELGTRKLYTTPHIMSDLYPNNEADILTKLSELQKKIANTGLEIEILAAAEYYLDETLLKKTESASHELLTFGNNYLLFETSFMNQPFHLNEFIFKARSRGYHPVLAHPERYAYIQNDHELVDDLIQRGVLLQLNIISLAGYYSKPVRKLAERLIEKGQVHFVGSDCHNMHQFAAIKEAMNNKYYHRAMDLPLKNFNL